MKIVSPQAILETWRVLGHRPRVVLCHGCWDGLHPGHVRHLQEAKTHGEILIASVTTDAWVNKGPGRPRIPDLLRAELVGALEMVDYVVLTPGESAAGLIRTVKPDVFAKGMDYRGDRDERTMLERQVLQSYGGQIVYTSGDVVMSSTVIFAP